MLYLNLRRHLARGRHQHLGMHLLAATAATHPANGTGVKIIQPDRQFQMTLRHGQPIGNVEAVPRVIESGFGPCMTGKVIGVLAAQVA